MASTPFPRNGSMPSHTISTSNIQRTSTVPAIAPLPGTNPQQQASARKPVTVAELQRRTRYIERQEPERYIDEDPGFPTESASILTGVSSELLKKWRQRGEGPAYFQFGREGRVVYALSDLNAFKAAHRVVPRKKGRK